LFQGRHANLSIKLSADNILYFIAF
jgi:hypothetical protein